MKMNQNRQRFVVLYNLNACLVLILESDAEIANKLLIIW